MMCDKCNERAASVVLTQIVSGKHIKLYLCEKCASQTEGLLGDDYSSFQQFLSTLINSKSSVKNDILKCDKCGMTLVDFKKNSKVGCAGCYKIFEDYFGSLVKRVHGNAEHTGKCPKKHDSSTILLRKINDLQNDLQSAIQNEEYELAAKIRDEIKQLKQGGNHA